MKKLIAVLLVSMGLTKNVHAYEQFLNPDRFISVGVKIENYRASGNYDTTTRLPSGFVAGDHGKAQEDSINLGLNLRVPMTSSMTMDLDYLNIDGERRTSRDEGIYNTVNGLTGYKASIGFRLYLNK